jgi:NTE family protein
MTSPFQLVLVLGGGNALGGYHAGVYQALHERGQEPDWIVGASAGAINGALIAGNPAEQRVARLTEFWQPATAGSLTSWWPSPAETMRRTVATTLTLVAGRPGVFGPIGPLGSWWDPDAAAAAPALFDLKPLTATLARMADWERINAGAPRYTATAVDLETGEDVVFDTSEMRVTPDHTRASASLMPSFPPVEIDGRAYVDGGLSANLPLDPVLANPPEGPVLCIAVDPLPLAGRRPQTLGEAIGRAQDLTFAAQSRRTIERWRTAYAFDPRLRSASVTLARLAYGSQDVEVAGKGMDFSPESVRHRWSAGHRDASELLGRLESGEVVVGGEGLTLV